MNPVKCFLLNFQHFFIFFSCSTSDGYELDDLFGDILDRPVGNVDERPFLAVVTQPFAVLNLFLYALQFRVPFDARVPELPYPVDPPLLQKNRIDDKAEHLIGIGLKLSTWYLSGDDRDVCHLPPHVGQVHGKRGLANPGGSDEDDVSFSDGSKGFSVIVPDGEIDRIHHPEIVPVDLLAEPWLFQRHLLKEFLQC